MSDGIQNSARPLPRLVGFPDVVYQKPAHGDSLTVASIRSHLGRCQDCARGTACPTAATLVQTLSPRKKGRR